LTDFEKISHLIRFGLSFNKMSLKTISDWADRKINDLATASTKNKIIELLSERVFWNYRDKEVRSLILSYYKNFLINNPDLWRDIEKELSEYFQYLYFENGNDSLQDFLYYLADDWQLRKEKNQGLLNMPEYLSKNLVEYNGYEELRKLLTEQGLTGYET
jgi:hypothetical protein